MSNLIEFKYDLDMYPGYNPRPIRLKQYSDSFSLVFKLHASKGELDIDSSTTAEIRGTKKSGTGYSASATLNISNGTVTVAGDAQMTAVAGQNIYEIVLIKNNKVLGSANFILLVERAALDADTITDETVLRNLEAIVEGAETATQAAEDAEDAADRAEAAAQTLEIDPTLTQAGQAADAKAAGGVRDNLQQTQQAVFLVEKLITGITSANDWTIGQKIVVDTGANSINSKYCRTDYIDIPSPLLICMDNSDYEFYVSEYTSAFYSSRTFAPKHDYDNRPALVTSDQLSNYFRISVRRVDGEDITSSDIDIIKLAIKTYAFTDTSFTISGAPADAKAVGDFMGASIFDLTGLANHSTHIGAGITYTYNGNNEWSVSGTVDGISYYPLFSSSLKTAPFVAGKSYKVWFTSTSSNIYLQLWKYVDSTLTLAESIYSKAGFQSVSFPADATGVILRIRTIASVSNETVTVYVYEDNAVFNKLSLIDTDLSTKIGYVKVLTQNDDLDTTTAVGVYCYTQYDKPSNAPVEESNAVLTVLHGFYSQGFRVQFCSTFTGKLFQRLQYTNGTWTAWSEISKGEAGGAIIQNTYTITTSPTITTDSNGWLQAVDTDTSDETGKTDMTGAIMSMLNDTGYCHLGEGIFYVSGNIDMPDGSTLCGCGKKTVVRLLQSITTGYCVKIGKYCTIKDISFEGARSFSMPSTKGTRNGIAFMANYDSSPSVTTNHCMISNVWCRYFSGAGIYCHNTSIRYDKGLYAVNVFINSCYVGIDIDYYSEFNKFTNVCISQCKIGCINNGGNNVFTACTFHATDTGFYIDGTQPNNAHGTMIGCTFCHIGSNAGKAIDIKNTINGFIIDSCQIWYNSINIENSSGIVISNCELGRGTTGAGATIVVNGGNTVMFVGCVFMNDINYAPDISITNNTKVKFVNCYGSVSGNAVTVA